MTDRKTRRETHVGGPSSPTGSQHVTMMTERCPSDYLLQESERRRAESLLCGDPEARRMPSRVQAAFDVSDLLLPAQQLETHGQQLAWPGLGTS